MKRKCFFDMDIFFRKERFRHVIYKLVLFVTIPFSWEIFPPSDLHLGAELIKKKTIHAMHTY